MIAVTVTEIPAEGGKRGLPDLGPFPCLNSNISTRPLGAPLNALSTQHRKTAFILGASVHQLAERHGVARLGFLTLTFADHVTCPKEAQRRLNSLISHVIKPRYGDYIGCLERQKSGRIHYHLLVVLGVDIRAGCDFEAIARRDYRTAPAALKAEWAYWRQVAPKYGFGRTELMPVRSHIEAMAKYVGKYIAKHIDSREERDKGVRLVRYSRAGRAGTTRFQFHSPGAAEWRRKVGIFAAILQAHYPDAEIRDISDIAPLAGNRWAYRNRDFIESL